MTLETPYFIIYQNRDPYLELGGDGSYAGCRAFVWTLQARFNARVTEELDGGAIPDALYPHPCDKEKGYWYLQIAGQAFLLMRDRGNGMCLWGPKPPESPATFLTIARFVGARERLTPARKVLSRLGLTRRRRT